MRKTKLIMIGTILVLLIPYVLALRFLSPFFDFHYGKRPCDQPFSTWISEDKRIYFEVDEHGHGNGTLKTKDGVIDIYFFTNRWIEDKIYIYQVTAGENKKQIEYWSIDSLRRNKFTATVDGQTTYFEIGQTIRFNRLSEGESVQREVSRQKNMEAR